MQVESLQRRRPKCRQEAQTVTAGHRFVDRWSFDSSGLALPSQTMAYSLQTFGSGRQTRHSKDQPGLAFVTEGPADNVAGEQAVA
eukprot:6209649-Pleurochrysis_carterae.AAC.3